MVAVLVLDFSGQGCAIGALLLVVVQVLAVETWVPVVANVVVRCLYTPTKLFPEPIATEINAPKVTRLVSTILSNLSPNIFI